MDFKGLTGFVRVNNARRQKLIGNSSTCGAEIYTYYYSAGDLGLIRPGLVREFYKKYIDSEQMFENQFNTSIVRCQYKGDSPHGLSMYQFEEGDIPVVLFDERALINNRLVHIFSDKRSFNPGFFIAPLKEKEFVIAEDSSVCDSAVSRYLSSFENLMNGHFGSLPIEVTKREIKSDEKKNLVDFYRKIEQSSQNVRARSRRIDNCVGS